MLVKVLPGLAQRNAETMLPSGGYRRLDEISSEGHMDFAPVLSADGRTMVFESNRKEGWRLYETTMGEDGKWSGPRAISEVNRFARKGDIIGGPDLSMDGKELYFFGFFLFKTTSEDIYVSERGVDGWKKPSPIKGEINTRNYEGFPSIAPDKKTLYFVRENKDMPIDKASGEPCFVIYRSEKDEKGNWSKGAALAAPVNLGCECSPKIMDDGRTLLFSSIREGGRGMYDIYQSRLQFDGSWSEPSLVKNVSTEGNELSPSIASSGKDMVYFRDNAIYQAGAPKGIGPLAHLVVDGKVRNGNTGEGVDFDATVVNKSSGETIAFISNLGLGGNFELMLTAGAVYEITFSSEGFENEIIELDLSEVEENARMKQVVSLLEATEVLF